MNEKEIYQTLWEIIDQHTILAKSGRPVFIKPELKGVLIKYCMQVIKEGIKND